MWHFLPIFHNVLCHFFIPTYSWLEFFKYFNISEEKKNSNEVMVKTFQMYTFITIIVEVEILVAVAVVVTAAVSSTTSTALMTFTRVCNQ